MPFSLNPQFLSPILYNQKLAVQQGQDFSRLGSELSSAGVSEDYSSVKDVKQFVGQEMVLEAVERYESTNEINRQRMSTASGILAQFRDIVGNFLQEISLVRSNEAVNLFQFQTSAKDKLAQMTSLLNTTFAGQYIFGGAASSMQPISDLAALPGLALNDPVDFSYYKGSTNNIVFRADDQTIVSTPLRADDKGIAELITSLRLCAYFPNEEKDDRLSRSLTMCQTAMNDMNDTAVALDYQLLSLESVKDNLMEMKQNLQKNIKEIGYKSEPEMIQEYAKTQMNLALSNYIATNSLIATRDFIDRLP